MTVKEFLGQSYLLNKKIKSDTLECEELRQIAESISCHGVEEHYNATRNTEAPFIHTLDKLWEMEEQVMDELALLINLKQQIRKTINQVGRSEQQLVLKYRYIHNYSWPKIGELLNADPSTVQRWHNKAINRIKLPENIINLKDAMVCN